MYRDKLVDDKDMANYDTIYTEIAKKFFEVYQLIFSSTPLCYYSIISQDAPEEVLAPNPHIYCHFATGIGEPKYFAMPSWQTLSNLLTEALDNYNEINAVMNLVLFEDAMSHM